MTGVSAVVPSWNQRDLLVSLLRNLGRQTCLPDEVLVVDNGSGDDSASQAESLGARVIRMGYNAGFSRAVNQGIRASTGEWIAVVNNDVELSETWIERMRHEALRAKAWFAAGKLYRTGSRQMLDGTFDALARSGCAWRCGSGRPDGPVWDRPRPVWFVPFTAVLLRRELFERVGYLDESFESYSEDVDFGLRCAAGGYQGCYVPGTVAWHQGSATLGRWHPETVRRMARNQLLMVAKHYPERWLLDLGWPVIVGQLLWGFVALRHGAGWAYAAGKWEGLRMFSRVRRDRNRQDSVEQILRSSEEDLRELQAQTGYDWYWRLYFALT